MLASFVAVGLAATSASALELVGSEVPSACQQICLPVVLLSGACAKAERSVLGNPPPPAAVPSSSSSLSFSSIPATTRPPVVTTPPPQPPLPPPPPSISSPSIATATTLSFISPPASMPPPAAAPIQSIRVPPPAQLTPFVPPPMTESPPPPPTPTEAATTSTSRRGRKSNGNRGSSREPVFGPAAQSFLAALSAAKSGRQRKGQDFGVAAIAPMLPTSVPDLDVIQERDVGDGDESAVGRPQALSAEEGLERDQFQQACYCRNLSFDVSGISGLCGSCIAQNVNAEQDRKGLADANSILAKCDFPTASYQPEAARQAAGITLVAVMPSRVPANNPGGLVFVPGVVSKSGDAVADGGDSDPVLADDSSSGAGQGQVQRGGVGEMASVAPLAVLTAVCWALLALVAV